MRIYGFCFFFSSRRRHTRCGRDWSSDVCSSDLIRDTGPCKKHITVTIDRGDIDARLDEQYSKLVVESTVAGFRPGKAPRKIIERRFQKDVGDQVKNEVLLASLEQLAEDHDIAPLNSPNIDP